VPLGDRPPEPLAPHEVRALLEACGGGSVTAIRNHALLVVFWRAGLRCAEALALRPSDVDFGAGTIRVLRGKGRRARTVGVDDAALAVLSVWIETRTAAGIGPTGPLFCTVQPPAGQPMHPRYVRALVARLGRQAGIQHRVHPHGLRHTMATEMIREGVPVTQISRQLGHSSIATTAVYLDHLHPADVIEMARARTWAS
jgi:integrase